MWEKRQIPSQWIWQVNEEDRVKRELKNPLNTTTAERKVLLGVIEQGQCQIQFMRCLDADMRRQKTVSQNKTSNNYIFESPSALLIHTPILSTAPLRIPLPPFQYLKLVI